MNNYLKAFIEQRNMWSTSINSQSIFLNQLVNLIDFGESVTDDVSVNYSRISSAISLTEDGLTGEFVNDEGIIEQFTVSPENIKPEYIIPGINISIATLLADITTSQQINAALSAINDVMLNYGEITSESANSIISSYDLNGMNEDFLALKQIIASCGNNVIYKEQWNSILFTFNNEVKRVAQNGDLVLDNNTKVVKQYVGSAILGIISTILTYAGLILTKVNIILGFVVAAIGSVINYIVSNTVNTHFEVDYGSINNELTTPVLAATIQKNESFNYNLPTDFVNSGLWHYDTLGLSHYFWMTNDEDKVLNTAFINTYMDLSLDFNKIAKFLAENDDIIQITEDDGLDLYLWISREYVNNPSYMFRASRITNLLNIIREDREEFHFDYTTLTAKLTDDSFIYNQIFGCYCLMALSSLAFSTYDSVSFDPGTKLLPKCLHLRRTSAQLSGDLGSSTAAGIFISTLHAMYAVGHEIIDDFYSLDRSNQASHISNILSNLISYPSDQSQSLMGLDFYNMEYKQGNTIIYNNVEVFCNVWNCAYDNIIDRKKINSQGILEDDELNISFCQNLNVLPSKHLVQWPDYAPKALLRTLGVIAGVMIVGVAVGVLARRAFSSWKIKGSIKSAKKVQTAKEDFDANPTYANAKKLYDAQNWYNLKAKLFGWSRYDGFNNWFTPASEISGTSNAVLNSLDLASIRTLITSS